MDMTILWGIVMISLIGIVLFTLVAYGEKPLNLPYESYKYLNYRMNDTPYVCIMQPEDPRIPYTQEYERAVLSGIYIWEYKLQEWYWGDDSIWNIEHEIIPNSTHFDKSPNDFLQCNVFIVFDYEGEGNQLGATGFDYSSSKHQYSYIFINTHAKPNSIILNPQGQEEITISLGNVTKAPLRLDTIRGITSHEFGHALGLHHYHPSTQSFSRSIMQPTLSAWNSVDYVDPQELDIWAVWNYYGDSGFDNPKVYKPKVIIPYPR